MSKINSKMLTIIAVVSVSLMILSLIITLIIVIKKGDDKKETSNEKTEKITTQTPTNTTTQSSNITTVTTTSTNITTNTNTPTVTTIDNTSGYINGNLSYPSDFIPEMKICAVDSITKKDITCVNTKQNQESYTLKVKPGNYYVYWIEIDKTLGKTRTYYITGDMKKLEEKPEWTDEGFVCSTDVSCKEYFKPYKFTIKAGQNISKIDLGNPIYMENEAEWNKYF